MKRNTCWGLVGLSLLLATLSGCQTEYAGMTLPSPRYLQHPPQYIPPSPRFPFERELARQEEIANRAAPGENAEGLPPRVPAGPFQP